MTGVGWTNPCCLWEPDALGLLRFGASYCPLDSCHCTCSSTTPSSSCCPTASSCSCDSTASSGSCNLFPVLVGLLLLPAAPSMFLPHMEGWQHYGALDQHWISTGSVLLVSPLLCTTAEWLWSFFPGRSFSCCLFLRSIPLSVSTKQKRRKVNRIGGAQRVCLI